MVVPLGQSMRWHSYALTDRGRRRRRNEDAALDLPESRIYAVADGMGGHSAGDVASRLATEALADCFPQAPSPRIRAAALTRRLLTAFDKANSAILEHAAAEPACLGMGTTLTALSPLVSEPLCVIAHVGDSRAYRLRAGALRQLTHDHTWVQQQVEAGMLTAVEARHHRLSSVLYRVLGTTAVGPADSFVTDAEPGDLFLLCSDGLTGMLDDETVTRLLLRDMPLDAVARSLVDAANEVGGHDNITVLLLRAEAA
jgi:serine/threonine protein phosphatase PrpC